MVQTTFLLSTRIYLLKYCYSICTIVVSTLSLKAFVDVSKTYFTSSHPKTDMKKVFFIFQNSFISVENIFISVAMKKVLSFDVHTCTVVVFTSLSEDVSVRKKGMS